MIDELFKKDSLRMVWLTIELSLFSYILLTQIQHGKEIAEMRMTDNFTAQQLNRIEMGQQSTNLKLDSLNSLVLRNIKITNVG